MTSGRALRAWLAGEPSVVVANMIEFAEELYGPAITRGGPAYWLDSVAEYSAVATLLAPNPSLVVLPYALDDWILDAQADLLGLSCRPTVVSGVGRNGSACREILRDRSVLDRLSSAGAPILAWSATPAFHELEARVFGATASMESANKISRSAALTFESKIHSHQLFRDLADSHVRVRVPHQHVADDPGAWLGILADKRKAGVSVFVKAEYGQAGYGMYMVDWQTIAEPTTRVVDRILAADPRFRSGRVIFEDAVSPNEAHPYLTVDLLVLGADSVVLVGAGDMIVEGTHYAGVTVGPSAVPPDLAQAVEAFGHDVGTRLGQEGYVGWYCVDFVHADDGTVSPTEINVRMSGSAYPLAVRHRLQVARGHDVVVRSYDYFPIEGSTPDGRAWTERARRVARSRDVEVVATMPPRPDVDDRTIGLVLVATSSAAIEEVCDGLALSRDPRVVT